MNINTCDSCGKNTYFSPPFEYEKNEDGSTKYIKAKQQDVFSGEVKEVEVAKVNWLKPKTIILRLKVGDESIAIDVCEECLNKTPEIKTKAKELWALLENIKAK